MNKHNLLAFFCLLFLSEFVLAQIPTNGLVAWYPFNGNANDESGSGNNGTVNGATLTSDRFGNANTAYNFNGINNYIHANAKYSANLTISLWIKTNATNNSLYPQIFSLGKEKYHLQIQSISNNAGTIGGVYSLINDNNSSITYQNNICDNKWRHIAVILNSAQRIHKIYINGQLVQSTTLDSIPLFNYIDIGISDSPCCGYSFSGYYQGIIDDISIYNRILSDTEILQIYNQLNCITATASIKGKTTICGTNPITLTATTNLVSPTFLWSTGATTSSISVSTSGTYNVTATQSDGCTKTASITVSSDNSCRCSDSLQLVTLYNATNGANWTNKWDLSQPIFLNNGNIDSINWKGIDANRNGCITLIKLTKNNLTGTLPSLNLPNLQVLWLDSNAIGGIIPNFDLPSLKSLNLDKNNFVSKIPYFNKISNLQILNLSNNQLLDTLPNFSLPELIGLYIGNNQLSGQIPNLSLSKLREFYAYTNNFATSTIPNFSLPELTQLDLSDCRLSTTITNFTGLPKLQYLYLYGNQLSGQIPAFYLPNLKSLRLYSNRLSGCIPPLIKVNCPLIGSTGGSIVNNPSLSTQNWANYWSIGEGACNLIDTASCRYKDSLALAAFYRSTNGQNWTSAARWILTQPMTTWKGVRLNTEGCVTGLDLDGVPNFEEDDATGNTGVGLTGKLPDSLRLLTNLTHLDLTKNTGLSNSNLPDVFANMTNLRWLEIYECGLTGSIPQSLGGKQNLYLIGLGGNKLNGTIPTNIGNCPNLVYLALCCNNLTGNIPKELSQLLNLKGLYVQNNKLSGCLAAELRVLCPRLLPNNGNISGNVGLSTQDWDGFCRNGNGLTPSTQNKTICQGQRYTLPSGRVVTAANTYRDTLKSLNGCDSAIVITNLSVSNTLQTTVNKTICQGQSYILPSRKIVSTTGIYRDTLKTIGNCDSVVITNLTVNPIITTPVSKTICQGQTYTLGNRKVVSASGLYTDSLKTVTGCDSIVLLNLTVTPTLSTTVNKSICSRQTHKLPSGRIVSVAGTYRDTLKSVGGCDSIVITNLSITPYVITKLTQRFCSGGSGNFRLSNGSVATKGGFYLDTLRSASGCDTILEITLIIDTVKVFKDDTLCPGQIYRLPSGKLVNVLGIYRDLIKRQGQCDTLYFITLTEGCLNRLKIYNGVYPDGIENRYFVVGGIENYPKSKLYIYTKTNDLIFQSAIPYDNLWNGTDQSGTPLPADTYYFVIDLGVPNQKPEQGYILLVR